MWGIAIVAVETDINVLSSLNENVEEKEPRRHLNNIPFNVSVYLAVHQFSETAVYASLFRTQQLYKCGGKCKQNKRRMGIDKYLFVHIKPRNTGPWKIYAFKNLAKYENGTLDLATELYMYLSIYLSMGVPNTT